MFQGALHAFDQDATAADLRWCRDAVNGCVWETLDGAGGGGGRVLGEVAGQCITPVVWGNTLHLFYKQDIPPNFGHVLRHAQLSGGTWTFETLDGNGGTHGRTTDRVGGCPGAAQFSSWLFITFYDYDNQALRLGWSNGVDWDFITLDGDAGGSGRINADVGMWSTMVSTPTSIRAFYVDDTNQDLREAFWAGTGDWSMATRDSSGFISGRIGAAIHQSIPHVFYYESSNGDLRHAWATPAWNSEVVDGDSNLGGRTTNWVGDQGISASSTASGLHVFYYDSTGGNLRHAWGPGNTSWTLETADGDSLVGGRMDADVGRSPASAAWGTGVRVFYRATPSAVIRQAAF